MTVARPALTFVVGVTGHRSARLKEEHKKRLQDQFLDVFRAIEDECRKQLEQQPDLYAPTRPQMVLLSSLADGTDALAVEQCPETWAIAGLLPSPQDEYEHVLKTTAPAGCGERAAGEFAKALRRCGGVTILPRPLLDDDKGLVRSRDVLLRQIDVLVAVWDGSPHVGLPGGTADTVEHATETGIPVIWIAADRPQRPWVISRVGDVERDTPMADATSGPIADLVRQALAISRSAHREREPWHIKHHALDAADRLNDFLSESIPTIDKGKRQSWDRFLSELPENKFKSRLVDVLLPRCLATDALARRYGRRYRLAYVSVYLLSSLAVAVALSSFLLHDNSHEAIPASELWLVGIELLIVASIVVIVWLGQAQRWHDRWLDYRALAEILRHLRFLSLVGQYEKSSYIEAAARPGADWLLWYFRATMRELGLPSGNLGPEYQRKILSATVAAELEPQIRYHAANLRMHRVWEHILHRSGNVVTALALALLLGFLVALSIGKQFTVWTGFLTSAARWIAAATAFLPSLGAAVTGIRFTGEFEGAAERSARTGAQLDLLQETYDVALERLDFDLSAGVLFESARIMAFDISGWTSLYSRKPLTLPG